MKRISSILINSTLIIAYWVGVWTIMSILVDKFIKAYLDDSKDDDDEQLGVYLIITIVSALLLYYFGDFSALD